MVVSPLLPITNESSFKSSTASHNFSLASPQYSFVTTWIWSINSIFHYWLKFENRIINVQKSPNKWLWNPNKKLQKLKKKTSFCLDAVSRMSRTSISVGKSYFFITSGSRNSANGIRATIIKQVPEKRNHKLFITIFRWIELRSEIENREEDAYENQIETTFYCETHRWSEISRVRCKTYRLYLPDCRSTIAAPPCCSSRSPSPPRFSYL